MCFEIGHVRAQSVVCAEGRVSQQCARERMWREVDAEIVLRCRHVYCPSGSDHEENREACGNGESSFHRGAKYFWIRTWRLVEFSHAVENKCRAGDVSLEEW